MCWEQSLCGLNIVENMVSKRTLETIGDLGPWTGLTFEVFHMPLKHFKGKVDRGTHHLKCSQNYQSAPKMFLDETAISLKCFSSHVDTELYSLPGSLSHSQCCAFPPAKPPWQGWEGTSKIENAQLLSSAVIRVEEQESLWPLHPWSPGSSWVWRESRTGCQWMLSCAGITFPITETERSPLLPPIFHQNQETRGGEAHLDSCSPPTRTPECRR